MAVVNDVEEDETRITLNDQGGPEDLSGRADDDSRHSSNLWKRTRTEACQACNAATSSCGGSFMVR